MNNVNLIGRLTRDVDVRYTQTNNAMVAQFSIAIDRPFAAKDNEERQTDFINIVAWNKTAEFCNKYFKKGLRVGISGRLQTRNYDDKDGKKVYVTEVIASEVCFADGRKDTNPFSESAQQPPITDEDLPF